MYNKLKIGLSLQKLPMRGLGRPRSLVGGLQRNSDSYDVDRLIHQTSRSTASVKLQAVDYLKRKVCTCGASSLSTETRWDIR
ncbi:hypothetical protein GN244_ATG19658 [Phytophthora infestans]|uniref:Uncharacterized protein n=1 Tax=Phytophthora infestans TaxID=4787 RepID=A0A833SL69_PHYIN|nr:hypothetical protein GN244_ATG19658 [Phytophthora infestans]